MDQPVTINYDSFTEENFDPVVWLNAIFDGNQNDQKKLANNLVFKLQLMIEETNDSLQEISQRMVTSLPKIMGEADVLGLEATELFKQIVSVRTNLICSDQQNSELIETMIQMDRAKKRLEDLYQALQEANNWSILSVDVEKVFENGDLESISNKLLKMQNSLQLLSLSDADSVDLDDKIKTLNELKDRFETLIQPKFIEILTNSPDSFVHLLKIFKDLNRFEKLIDFYKSFIKNQVLNEWKTYMSLQNDQTIFDKLNFLYDKIQTVFKVQISFSQKHIYAEDLGKNLTLVCETLTATISSLEPSIETLIDQSLQKQALINRSKHLNELKQFSQVFLKNIKFIIGNQACFEKRSEDQTNISDEDFDSLKRFIRIIYQPFGKMNVNYCRFESEKLKEEFDSILTRYDDLICDVTVKKLFSLTKESFNNYSNYVESYPLLIIDEIERFLLNYLRKASEKIDSLKFSDYQSIKSSKILTNLTPEWNEIQKYLFYFQTSGEFLNQLNELNQKIFNTFIEYENKINQNSTISTDIFAKIFQRLDLYILNLDKDDELSERLRILLSNPNQINRYAMDEAKKFIKKIAKKICSSLFEYVRIYFENFDVLTGKQRNPNQLKTNANHYDDDHEIKSDEDAFDDDQDSIALLPNEYITQIGQYLLMLPQHFETFNLNENQAFRTAFQNSKEIFQPNKIASSQDIEKSNTEMILEFALTETSKAFIDQIYKMTMRIKKYDGVKRTNKLKLNTRKQLIADLSYLDAVCGDLGYHNEFIGIIIRVFKESDSNLDNLAQNLSKEDQKIFQTIKEVIRC
ncbi:conserved oligomeric Golgi complex subunit 7-like protein [Sarcoptes scabiei]|uniref:Conserved oligomeric Golgi complex subunit 7 n=1 Tax=Sarcoptes scabiei TaxID=52283 RepID=A0A132A5E2_SARSC|nr:conserved oligomeric Golgi complex subunit 7-like protein [Sarcoptes scabiei]